MTQILRIFTDFPFEYRISAQIRLICVIRVLYDSHDSYFVLF